MNMNFHQHAIPRDWQQINVRVDPEIKELLIKRHYETGDSINKIVNNYIVAGLQQEVLHDDEEEQN